ncbi:hypothetical protein BDZ85DRAFT_230087 [Elsinoe ampelina]|uniref:C2H2-type domain-containing protein n=1 Tax=Elsinoe ampelina TaxID=302913 RepID=A0A6A6GLH2_9PEZI|nr:hypothetical protein BDZ85DRAFT_230087 [Elsinoe ampelina]
MDTSFDAYTRSPPPRTEGFDRRANSRERERDPYRDNRRGQDRRRGGTRNRSRSPTQIDRYQPDRQRDDYYAGGRDRDGGRRRRSSPPPPSNIDRYIPGDESGMMRAIPLNRIRDPLVEASQVGFSYFSEWWRAEQDIKAAKERQKTGRRPEVPKDTPEEQRAKIQAAYDDYKLAWNAKMAKLFVYAHKNDNWFRERYDPEIKDPLRARIAEFRKGLYEFWERDIDAGVFDEFTMEGIYKSESNGAGGVVEREEGEASAAAEVLNVSDLLPAKGADLRDPVASLPTLLIKTITPAVSRAKIEEFCKEHLGEGEGGFKWLSLSDPNPGKKFHRLGWVMLNPPADGDNNDAPVKRNSDANGEIKEEGAMEEDTPRPQTTQEKALGLINDKTIHDSEKGDFTVHVGIHRPSETNRKKALWDLFSAPERIEKDLGLAIRLVNKLDEDVGLPGALLKVEQRVDDLAGKGYLQPPIVPTKSAKTEQDDGDAEMEEGEEGEEVEDDVDDEDMLIKKKKLDLLVEYLRRVHNFCFFCVFETDSVHELSRKCMGGHLRRPRASLTTTAKEVAKASAAGDEFPNEKNESTENGDGSASPNAGRKPQRMFGGKNQLQKAFNWVKTFEEKINQVLEPENADLRKMGGAPIEEALEQELNKFVKQEDAAKYRCKVPECTKLFKGVDFWRKHVEKRHPEWYAKTKEDLETINRYVLDPSRLAQGRNDAASNGHFPIQNAQIMGTPRNFSLNSGAQMGNGFLPQAPPGVFNPMMGQYPMTVANTWSMQGPDGGIGPMRNGMRMNARGPAPYDRGGPRRNNGRLSPPGRGGMPGRGRPNFTEGGIGTFGGAQAVEGRTMKSYNDLDAANTGQQGGGELDY